MFNSCVAKLDTPFVGWGVVNMAQGLCEIKSVSGWWMLGYGQGKWGNGGCFGPSLHRRGCCTMGAYCTAACLSMCTS
ncbi:hypothetical protein FA13DRAFT_857785 [Coprinellus micaceus]|uniref:Uncharacterized protein n=1 Tax=Coprinellus micaceus TaxID=71717 RepID=A0A4Y7T0W5_COPMI|nr:hypothetical protein FA13DRAFT_857785 [Coprinellus micaceus]